MILYHWQCPAFIEETNIRQSQLEVNVGHFKQNSHELICVCVCVRARVCVCVCTSINIHECVYMSLMYAESDVCRV